MTRTLYAWIGESDRRAFRDREPPGREEGPILRTLQEAARDPDTFGIDRAVLLDDKPSGEPSDPPAYADWLRKNSGSPSTLEIEIVSKPLPGQATDLSAIFDAARKAVREAENGRPAKERFYLFSAGTPAMAACWLVLSRLPEAGGELLQAGRQEGVKFALLPYDIANLTIAPAPMTPRTAAKAAKSLAAESARQAGDGLVAECAAMKRQVDLARRAARSPIPVLILGETGTGKEEFARLIHDHSGRTGKFIPINCGALPGALLEAELFGHKKGAFTGAEADREGLFEAAGEGTVFLDEIGEMPLEQQVKLLRVLQEGQVRRLGETSELRIKCRIVAATHRDPLAQVADGRLREDLFYRLAAIVLDLPPLRERAEDLDVLVERFWSQTVQENPGFPGRSLAEAALAALRDHPWPGNVRELRATLARASFLAGSDEVSATDIEAALIRPRQAGTAAPDPAIGSGFHLDEHLAKVHDDFVERALAETGGNQRRAAEWLGIAPSTLSKRLKKRNSGPGAP